MASKIIFTEETDIVTTPDAGKVVVYTKSDGRPYAKDDTGLEVPMFVGTGAVDSDQLAAGAVTAAKIEDSSVTTGKLATSAVTSTKILDGAITTDKVADAAITAAKLASGAGSGVANRQGGHATNWNTAGTTNYTPSAVRLQTGVASGVGGILTITFPVAFSGKPVVLVTSYQAGAPATVDNTLTTTTQAVVNYGAGTTGPVGWLAIGPV